MGLIDASYVYLGYLLDRVEMDDPGTDVTGIAASAGSSLTGTAPGQAMELAKYVLCEPLLEDKLDYAAAAKRADADVTVPAGLGNGGGETIYRLRAGIERFLITDINDATADAMEQSGIWLMLDNYSAGTDTFNHTPHGSNVLYLDGHVSFVRYSDDGAGPVNRRCSSMLDLLHAIADCTN